MFDGAAEAEPCSQWNAAGGLRGKVGEVEDDEAEASAFEQQVGGAEDLLETVFGLRRDISPRPTTIEIESGLDSVARGS